MAEDPSTYPVLTVPQLVERLHLIIPDLRVAEAQLTQPKGPRIREIYMYLLSYIGCNGQHFAQEPLEVEYSELYENSKGFLYLAKVLPVLLCHLKVNDFRMSDLKDDPNAKRLKFILSALLNFVIYLTEKENMVEAVQEWVKQQKSRQEGLNKRLQELCKHKVELQEAQCEENLQAEELKAEMDAQTSILQTLKKRREAQEKEMNALQKVSLEKEKTRLAWQAELQKLEGNINQLSMQKVSSPKRLKREAEESEKELQQLRAQSRDKKSHLTQMRLRQNTLTQALQDAQDLDAVFIKVKDAFKELRKKSLKATEVEASFMLQKKIELQRGFQEVESALQVSKNKCSQKESMFRETRQELRNAMEQNKERLIDLIAQNLTTKLKCLKEDIEKDKRRKEEFQKVMKERKQDRELAFRNLVVQCNELRAKASEVITSQMQHFEKSTLLQDMQEITVCEEERVNPAVVKQAKNKFHEML